MRKTIVNFAVMAIVAIAVIAGGVAAVEASSYSDCVGWCDLLSAGFGVNYDCPAVCENTTCNCWCEDNTAYIKCGGDEASRPCRGDWEYRGGCENGQCYEIISTEREVVEDYKSIDTTHIGNPNWPKRPTPVHIGGNWQQP